MKYGIRTQPQDIPDNPTPEELDDLNKLLLAHRHLYYGTIGQAISDYEYDMLERRIAKVAPELPAIQSVGTTSEDTEIIALAMKLKKG